MRLHPQGAGRSDAIRPQKKLPLSTRTWDRPSAPGRGERLGYALEELLGGERLDEAAVDARLARAHVRYLFRHAVLACVADARKLSASLNAAVASQPP